MRYFIKKCITLGVDFLAARRGFSFPAKYTWRWKGDMLAGRYEPETTSLLKRILKPGMIFIDVGAHIGYFTRLASRTVGPTGHVYAYEADEENYGLLSLNTRGRQNVTLRKVAISSHEGTVDFYHLSNSTGCHSTVPPLGEQRKIEVEARTLDDELERLHIAHVDVIKMDIEGGEWEALRGMPQLLAQNNLSMIVEWNPQALARGGDPLSFLSKLVDAGFTLSALTQNGPLTLNPTHLTEAHACLDSKGSVNIYCTK